MKFLAWIGGFILVVLVSVYTLAFTSLGNGIVGPLVQGKIKEATKLDAKLSTFSLSMSDFEIVLELSKSNVITIKGNYGLFSQAFDIAYRVKLEAVEELKSLTNAPLVGRVFTEGKVKGDMAFIEVDGVSDIAKSDTSYHIELTDLNPTSIIAKVSKADLLSLLKLGGQAAYASAEINLDVNFKNIKAHQLDGDIVLNTKNGKLDTKLMKSDFNVTIPHTAFSMNLDAKLKGDDVNYIYALNSNLAKLTSSGKVVPEPLALELIYGVDVKELAVLKPITGADVRGAFRLNGNVKGSKAKLVVDGKSDFASSNTTFSALLENFKPSTVKASMKNLRLQKVLYMVKQPHYADGIFSLDVDITNAKAGELSGTVVSHVSKGLVDAKYMTKAYEFKSPMPKTTFNMKTTTKLNKNILDTELDFNSNLANFDIKRARFDIKDASIVSDYKVKVLDLNRLFFATERHMKGSVTATGELKKAKELDFTAHSEVVGGVVDAKLHNDDFHADMKGLQTLSVLDMLLYPKIFKSSLFGTMDYNLKAQKGVMKADLKDGKFTKNQVLDLAKQYGGVNMYVENFKGKVNADINKEHIVASLDLKSNRSAIVTKNTKLNSKTKKINSKIDINADGNPLVITLKGNVNSPDVGIDAQKLIEKEATKAVTKEINKYLKGFF